MQSPNVAIPIHKIEKTLDVSSIIYAKNCRFSDSRATRFSSHRKRDATGDSLLSGTVSHNTICYSEVARETRSRWLSSALWGCFGDEFSYGGKFVTRNSPTMYFENYLEPITRATNS